MRRDERNHRAASVKEINHSSFKEKDKHWIQCDVCNDWLWEETYYKVSWSIGSAVYWPIAWACTSVRVPVWRICNYCCNTPLDVVDYLTAREESNKEAYEKSRKAYEKKEKKKEAEALAIVDGKEYTFTFKEKK